MRGVLVADNISGTRAPVFLARAGANCGLLTPRVTQYIMAPSRLR